jgi:hypothetical protein
VGDADPDRLRWDAERLSREDLRRRSHREVRTGGASFDEIDGDFGARVAGADHEDLLTAVGLGAAVGRGKQPAAVTALESQDRRVNADVEPVPLGVVLEIRDDADASNPATMPARKAAAREIRECAGRVQVEPVVVAPPARSDV